MPNLLELDTPAEKRMTLRGETIAADFQAVVENYIQQRFGANAATPSN